MVLRHTKSDIPQQPVNAVAFIDRAIAGDTVLAQRDEPASCVVCRHGVGGVVGLDEFADGCGLLRRRRVLFDVGSIKLNTAQSVEGGGGVTAPVLLSLHF